jgi:hypothetical protein
MSLQKEINAKVRKFVTAANPKTYTKSGLTTGKILIQGVNNTSAWARRLRDLIGLYESDLGGTSECSEAERSIVRRAAALTVECERLETVMALSPTVDPDILDLYSRASNSMRRHLEATGIKRRPRDVTPPSVDSYLADVEVSDD